MYLLIAIGLVSAPAGSAAVTTILTLEASTAFVKLMTLEAGMAVSKT
jgi:hypothetical protein